MLKAIINQWFDYIDQRMTPQTVHLYIGVIDRYNQSVTHLPQTASDVEKYITAFASHHKARTVNSHLTAIKSFYKWAEKQGLDNAAASVNFLKEDPPKSRCLSPQEYELVLQFSKDNLRKAIQFLGNTGLRESEFRKLTWASFSPDLQFVHVDGKGRKQREVPLNDTCRQLLASLHNGIRPDFVEAFKVQHHFYFHCHQLAERVRIPPFGSHALRHFFATRLLRKGVPILKVSQILGHSNVLITQKIYTHFLPQDFLGITDVLSF